MLKYVLVPLLVFNVFSYANEMPSNQEDLQITDICDTLYDQCIEKCDAKDTENIACYSKCENVYEECVIKQEQETQQQQ